MHIDVDGLDINYVDEGTGRNVLLLHGWGADIRTMMPIFNILKDKMRVVALDLPGFGSSSAPDRPWDTYDYAEFVSRFSELLGISDAVLFGHSHGGRISIVLAARYKKIVSKLVLIDSAGLIPKRKAVYYVKVYGFKLMKKAYVALARGDTKEEKLEGFYKKFGSEDYRATQGVMRQTMVRVINDNLEELLEEIEAPTLLIWGDKDEDTPLYMGQKMEKSIKDSGLIVLEGAGHYSYIDCYDKFRAVITVFLKDDFS